MLQDGRNINLDLLSEVRATKVQGFIYERWRML